MSVINTNVKSLIAQDSLRANNNKLSTAMERLSTGSKINSAKDDAAGLAIGTRMTAQVRGLNMAIKNANDGINLAQTAEGAMTEVTDMLQRMRELAVQAGNSTNTDADRAAMNDEVTQLKAEIDRVAGTTQFNNMNILDGSFQGKKLQIGNNADQTMEIGVKSVSTASMGETTAGLAVGSTTAKLTVAGAVTNAAAYQGASFNVNVNGVNKTVTLPVVNPSMVNVGGATANITPVVADRTVNMTTTGQIGGFDQKIADLSTDANATLEISLNGGAAQVIDVSAEKYYVEITRATGQEVVDALQAELDDNAAFQGDNALKVSLTEGGRIKFEMANGGPGVIALSESGAHNMLTTLTGSATSISSTTGSLEVGSPKVDLTGDTSFDVGNDHFDLTAAINSHGFDITKLSADEFITVYNETAKVNGVQVSQAVKSTPGAATITFIGTDPSAPVSSPFNNGSLVGASGINGTSSTTAFNDAFAGSEFGQSAIVVTGSTDDTFNISVDGATGVDVKVAAKTYNTMQDVASALQAAIDASAAFTGDKAITVSAALDENKRIGLSFSNAQGKSIEVGGNFLTGNSANSGGVSATFAASTNISSTTGYDSGVVTINAATEPVGVGSVFTQTTRDLSTAIDRKFVINVNGSGNVSLDLTDALTARGYDNTEMTGQQLVNVLNDTLSANGNFTGNNAVTASLTSEGQLKLQVAGAPVGGGNPSIVLSDDGAAGAPTSNFVEKITGLNGGTAVNSLTANAAGGLVISSVGDLEKFGIADFAVNASLGNNKLALAVGSSAPVGLTVDSAVYTNAQSLVDNINSKIALSGDLAGKVSAFVSTDATTGDQSVGFTAASGEPVTFTGGLAVDMKTTQTRATVNTATILAVGATYTTGDKINFTYNGTSYSATLPTIASAGVDAGTQLQTAIDTAVDSNGNAIGAGKITIADGGADLTLTLDQTAARTSRDSDLISNVNFTTAAGVVTAGKTTTVTLAAVGGTFATEDRIKFSYDGIAYTAKLGTIATAGTDGGTQLTDAISAAVDANGNVLGSGKVTIADGGTDLTLSATGLGHSVGNASFVTKVNYLSAAEDTVFPGTRIPTGGVNLSGSNQVSMSVTNAAGTVETRNLTLASSDAHVSLSDYANLLKDAANAAFADTGTTFSASYTNGQFSFSANQADIASLSMTGASVSSAFGESVSGTYAQAEAQIGKFYTMSDVASAINADLGGAAIAAFDAASNSWSFTASGAAGSNSTISLSGAGLSSIEFGGNLSATGAAGNATAAKLADIDVLTTANATAALSSIDNSIEYVSKQRSLLGAIQNRLEHTVNNLTNIVTNTEASRSAIMDADYSKETTALAKSQILTQAATAMLAQANQSAQGVLSLLK